MQKKRKGGRAAVLLRSAYCSGFGNSRNTNMARERKDEIEVVEKRQKNPKSI
jgi:hypothetical protein